MEGVKRFIEKLEMVFEKFRHISEKKKELIKLVESFEFPSTTLAANLSRVYELYEDEAGSIALVVEGNRVEVDVRTHVDSREKLITDVGLSKDYYHWRLANLLFFVKHAEDMVPALERILRGLSDEEEFIKRFLEELKELVAIIEMWKLSRENSR